MSSPAKKAGGGGGAVSLPKVGNSNNSSSSNATTNNKSDKGDKGAAQTNNKAKEDPKKASSAKPTVKSNDTALPKIGRPNSAGAATTAATAGSEAPTDVLPAVIPAPDASSATATGDTVPAGNTDNFSVSAAVAEPSAPTAQVPEPLAEAAPAEPVEQKPPVNINGNVVLIYEMYNESFPIVQGSTTAANIDEVYCLSYVMPNCVIKLSPHPPAEKRRLEAEGSTLTQFFIFEEPRGTYQGLVADATYYVYVEQEAAQLARDQARMKEIASVMDGNKQEGARAEGCSCLYGNPCIDQYICKDWNNRFAVATKNGWKGF
jgi:hypothetical protein